MKSIGLMGCGTVANYGHLPAIKRTDGLTLTALYDPDPENLAKAKEAFSVPHAFTRPEPFFASGIDAVAITSPAPCHHRNVLDAVHNGVPILCEKPLAMTESECQDMITAARKNDVLLCTGFDYRFSPVSLKIRDLVSTGAIGEVRSLRLIYIWHCHGKFTRSEAGETVVNQRRHLRMLEGGPMVDCGVHQIDLARFWLQSEVVTAGAHGAWVDEYDAPDHMYLHMDHANGAHSMVEMSFSYCHTAAEPVNTFLYELIGTHGVIRYDRNAKRFEMRNREKTVSFPFAGEKNFDGMYAAFAQAVETGKPGMLPTGEDGLAAARISRETTDALIRSRRDARS